MQLAILVGANPRAANSSARIRLRKGSWSLRFEGLLDSILIIHTLTPRAAPYGDQHIQYEVAGCAKVDDLDLEIEHPTMVFLEWKYRGTEKAISINAHIDRE
jgi:hypothetical protein